MEYKAKFEGVDVDVTQNYAGEVRMRAAGVSKEEAAKVAAGVLLGHALPRGEVTTGELHARAEHGRFTVIACAALALQEMPLLIQPELVRASEEREDLLRELDQARDEKKRAQADAEKAAREVVTLRERLTAADAEAEAARALLSEAAKA